MKKIIGFGIKAGVAAGAFLGFALTAAAVGTWTAPTATPPANNVDAPINVGASGQWKAGGMGVGRTSAPSWYGPTTGGSIFDVNGVTSMNGIANFGASALVQHVTIGTPPCPLGGCATTSTTGTSGGTSTSGGSSSGGTSGTSLPGSGSSSSGPTGMLLPGGAGKGTTLFAKINDALGAFFSTKKAIAAGTIPDCAYANTSGSFGGWYAAGTACHTDGSGILPGYSCQPNDTGGMSCMPPYSGGGSTSGTGTSGTATAITDPTIVFTPASAVITSGSSDSISWSASNASTCGVTSSNGTNDWNSALTISSSTHSGSGSRSLGTFATNGSYTYYMTCTSPSGGSATKTANITVGPTYILDVYGNSAFHGYVNVDNYLNAATLKQGGIPVCLQNGTNCPAANSFGPYPKIYSDITNEYAVYGANAASGGGTRVQVNASSIRFGTSLTNPAMAINGDEVSINGASNRNSPLLKITSTGTANGDNLDSTNRGLTIEVPSAVGQGRLLHVKKGSSEVFSVAANNKVWVNGDLITTGFIMNGTGAGTADVGKVLTAVGGGRGEWRTVGAASRGPQIWSYMCGPAGPLLSTSSNPQCPVGVIRTGLTSIGYLMP